MPSRPNFTDVDRRGGALVVTGQSDAEPEGDIVGIHVVATQGGASTGGTVHQPGGNWIVELPGEGFDAGAVTVVGVETRRENATSITWTQTLEIA